MPFGLNNTITLENISIIANVTEFPEFMINVNEYMYHGYLYFILFVAMWLIGILILQELEDQILTNAFISSGIMSVIVFIARAIEYTSNGKTLYLLTDYQLWVFALMTIILGGILWATKEKGA